MEMVFNFFQLVISMPLDEGYGDFTDQIANLAPGSTPLTITTGYGNQYDCMDRLNDDNDFTDDEKVVDTFVIASGQTAGTYTETVDVIIPESSNLGNHRMSKDQLDNSDQSSCQQHTVKQN